MLKKRNSGITRDPGAVGSNMTVAKLLSAGKHTHGETCSTFDINGSASVFQYSCVVDHRPGQTESSLAIHVSCQRHNNVPFHRFSRGACFVLRLRRPSLSKISTKQSIKIVHQLPRAKRFRRPAAPLSASKLASISSSSWSSSSSASN
jgi:hypothetical protein